MNTGSSQPLTAMEESGVAPRRLSLAKMSLLLLGGATLILLVGFGLVCYLMLANHWAFFASERDRLREAGLPFTPGEVDAWYVVDAGRPDATEAWVTATSAIGAQFGKQDRSRLQMLERDHWQIADLALSDEELEAFLEPFFSVFPLIDAAVAAGSNVRYPCDYTLMYEMPLTHQEETLAVARLLRLRAIQSIRADRIDEALADLDATVTAAETLDREPCMMCLTIRLALDAAVVYQARQYISDLPLTEEQLQRIARTIERIDPSRLWRSAIVGERASSFAVIESLSPGQGDSFDLAAYTLGPWRVRDQRVILETYRELESAVQEPLFGRMRDRAEAIGDRFGEQVRTNWPNLRLAPMFMPAYLNLVHQHASLVGFRALTLAAIDVRRASLAGDPIPSAWEDGATDPSRPLRLTTPVAIAEVKPFEPRLLTSDLFENEPMDHERTDSESSVTELRLPVDAVVPWRRKSHKERYFELTVPIFDNGSPSVVSEDAKPRRTFLYAESIVLPESPDPAVFTAAYHRQPHEGLEPDPEQDESSP